MTVTLDTIVAARRRIAGGVFRTPCTEAPGLSALVGARVFCKLEYKQRTGSFKERGARNALELLDPDARGRGVVAASAGNHALALAWHGRDLGIPVTVVMPRTAPIVKQTRCAGYGARVELAGANIGEAKERADELVLSNGLTYVHGFDGADIIAGQGTIGLELLEEIDDLDAVVVPVGGGGLLAGVAVAIKALRPEVEIIGVEPARAASFSAAAVAGEPVRIEMQPTLADGLAVPEVGGRAFELAHGLVDELHTVDEESISLAILRLAELHRGVVEGGGAATLAAFLEGRLERLRGRTVALLLCGGNIDPMVLSRVIQHGLTVDGRLVRFTAIVRDRPGGLHQLVDAIAAAGASVRDIRHERAFGGPDVSTVLVDCTIEVRDRAHGESVLAGVQAAGLDLRRIDESDPSR